MTKPLTLRELTADDEAAFIAGLEAWAGESAHWYSFLWTNTGMSYPAMLERLRKDRLGEDLPDDWVPHTMLYAFVDGAIVGRVSIRHQLNDQLCVRGGHIGYSVAPAARRRGHATEMFRQALVYCRSLGLDRIMITCDDDNPPSWKLLERAGAVLDETFFDAEHDALVRRYWLAL